MARYAVVDVQIESGVINTMHAGNTDTQHGYRKTQPRAKRYPVTGWRFNAVFLTHGDTENGSGYAFIRNR